MAIKKQNTKKRGKKKPPAKKPASKKTPLKKTAVRTTPAGKKVAGKKAGIKIARGKTASAPRKRVRGKSEIVDTVTFEPVGLGARSGGQSGDLQGLSNAGRANSESVDELLEEGNSFEAEVVKGVEDAGDADEGEVHTHEVPEDDVPGEYLDKD
jgi:hypothetical protein